MTWASGLLRQTLYKFTHRLVLRFLINHVGIQMPRPLDRVHGGVANFLGNLSRIVSAPADLTISITDQERAIQ